MTIAALINQKGGAGKTTAAVELAAADARAGRSVLVVDMDPQASATTWLAPTVGLSPTIGDVLLGKANTTDAITASTIDGVDLIPANLDLGVDAARDFGARVTPYQRLADVLGDVPEYDRIYIDCPPALGTLTLMGLRAADGVLIPVQPSALDVAALDPLEETLDAVRDELDHPIEVFGVWVSQGRHTAITADVEQLLADRSGDAMLPTIPSLVVFQEVASQGASVADLGYRGRPAAEAMDRFSAAVAERIAAWQD